MICKSFSLLSLFIVSAVTAQNNSMNTLVDSLLSKLDGYLQKENMSEITIAPLSENFGFGSFSLDGGYVKNLSSIYRIGDATLQTDSPSTTLNFAIGFKTLDIHFGNVKLDTPIMEIDDTVTVASRNNKLQVGLKLTMSSDDNCQVSISQASSDLGDFDVTLTGSDGTKHFWDSIMGFFAEKVLNLFSTTVETYIDPQLKGTLNSAISKMDLSSYCKML